MQVVSSFLIKDTVCSCPEGTRHENDRHADGARVSDEIDKVRLNNMRLLAEVIQTMCDGVVRSQTTGADLMIQSNTEQVSLPTFSKV